MATRHLITREDFDFGVLAEEIITRLGTGASAVLIEVDGHDEIAVIDANAQELDVSSAIVAQAIADHVDPDVALTPLEELAAVLNAPGTAAQKIAALGTWARVESEERRRNRPPRRSRR